MWVLGNVATFTSASPRQTTTPPVANPAIKPPFLACM